MSEESGDSQGAIQPTVTTVGCSDSEEKGPDIVLFTTSCAANAKVQSDTRRLKYLLKAKNVRYREIDLSENPQSRIIMLEQSDCIIEVPQIHVNGRYLGTAEEIQEQEDFGELEDLLHGEDPTHVIERTKQAIADRLLLERENTGPVVVVRKPALGHPKND
jgi:glutaredoxin